MLTFSTSGFLGILGAIYLGGQAVRTFRRLPNVRRMWRETRGRVSALRERVSVSASGEGAVAEADVVSAVYLEAPAVALVRVQIGNGP